MMDASTLRGTAIWLCGALFLLAVILRLLPMTDASAVRLSGGCAPSQSPYLQQAPQLRSGAITYCTGQDTDTGSITLELPEGLPAQGRLVTAGYIDGQAVSLRITSQAVDAVPVEIVQLGRERWTALEWTPPPTWQGHALRVTVIDNGSGHTQWGGIGIIGPQPALSKAWLWALGLAALAALAALCVRDADATPTRLRPVAWLPTVVLILAVFIGASQVLRTDVAGVWSHPDESIPVKVMASMNAHGDLDVDWARADLPQFAAFRYNFAGYILASYLSAKAVQPQAFLSDAGLLGYLLDVSRLCTAATIALCLLFLLYRTRLPYALAGTLAVAVIPQFYQEAHYARAEAMSTLLATLMFCLACLRPSGWRGRILLMAALGAMAGALTSIKFTYAVFLMFCVIVALPMLPRPASVAAQVRVLAGLGLVAAGGFLLGFSAAAPSVLVDLPGYLAGIQALNAQYGGGHPPHGSLQAGPGSQFALIAGYYGATLGLPMLLLYLLGNVRNTMAPAKQAFAIIAGITLLAFLTQKVFFERNFSVFLPSIVLVAVAGLGNLEHWLARRVPQLAGRGRPWLVAALTAALLLAAWPALSVSLRLAPYFSSKAYAAKQQEQQQRVQRAMTQLGAVSIEYIDFPRIVSGTLPDARAGCVLYQGISYNDEWSERYYQQLNGQLQLLQRIGSDFDEVPVSTLQTYHSPTTLLFYDPDQCPGAAPPP